MESIVTNSTVDGVLAALFAVLIIVVILDASRVWMKAIRAREPLPDTESPFVAARIMAPAGMFWTAEERAMLEAAGGTGNGAVRAGSGRFERAPGSEEEPAGAGGRSP